MPFVVGEQVGAYRIVEQLGQGGMSTVYKAYHAALDRYVALKVLHPVFKGDSDFLVRFQREARIVARLEHPHIVPVYDFSEHEGTPYLVMRFVEGRTLKAVLADEGVLPLGRIVQLLRPVCEALECAHGQGVLHRDIKPSNVLLSQEGKVYVTDFGLAKMVESGETTISQDRMIGTPQYISPEQAKGGTLDQRTDLYSLGVILFEMVTGRVPYIADTPFAIVHDHIFSPLPLPSRLNPAVPPAVEQVILKALAKEPADRYQSAGELFRALAVLTPPQPTVAEAPSPAIGEKAAGSGLAAAAPVPGPSTVTFPVPAAPTPPAAAASAAGSSLSGSVALAAPGSSTAARPAAGAPAKRSRPWWVWLLVGLAGLAVVAVLLILGLRFLARQRERLATPVVLETPLFTRPAEVRPLGREDIFPLSPAPMPEEEARRALLEVGQQIDQNPQDPALHVRRGDLLYELGRWEEAAQEYRRALEIRPDFGWAHYGLGVSCLQMGWLGEAIANLELLLERYPAEAGPQAYLNLAIAYAMDGQRAPAVETVRRFLRSGTVDDLWRQRARDLLARLGEQE